MKCANHCVSDYSTYAIISFTAYMKKCSRFDFSKYKNVHFLSFELFSSHPQKTLGTQTPYIKTKALLVTYGIH